MPGVGISPERGGGQCASSKGSGPSSSSPPRHTVARGARGGAGDNGAEVQCRHVAQPAQESAPSRSPTPSSRAFGATAIHIEGGTLTFAVLIVSPGRETFVAGHIHTGAAGSNGNVLVPLFAGSSSAGLFFQADSIEIGTEHAAAICGTLAGHYVNYHTTLDPQGAVRGQLG